MSTTQGRGPLGDDELTRALSEGLSRRLDADIDTAALLRGARDGARRIERRRTVVRRGVVTLVVVALLPVGVGFLKDTGFGGGSSSGGSAASAPEAAAAASSVAGSVNDAAGAVGGGYGAASSSSSSAAAVPSATVKRGVESGAALAPKGIPFSAKDGVLLRDAGEVAVPDSALLTPDDLGLTALTLTEDTGGEADRARTTVTTVVPLCGTGPAESLAQGGRTVAWTGTAQGRDGWSVATAVRVFSGTGATDELTRLRRVVGTCPGSSGVARETIAGLPGDDVLVAVLPPDTTGQVVVGVLRQGRVTVGVEVVVPPSSDPAADRADGVARVRALLSRADARVGEFAAAAETDPTLG